MKELCQSLDTLPFLLLLLLLIYHGSVVWKDECKPSTSKSTRQKLKELGYPLLDENKTIIKAVKQYSLEAENKDSLIASLCSVRRVLGYVEFMTETKDDHGWVLLLKTERIKEYIQLAKKSAGASPSTVKNYCDRIVVLLRLAETHFFDQPGIPQDPHEVSAKPTHPTSESWECAWISYEFWTFNKRGLFLTYYSIP